jgi:glycerophosphoryl diester phosphodiesterase
MAAQLVFGTGNSAEFGTTGNGTSATLSFNKTTLSNVVVGDLLVAWIHNQSSGTGSITPPSGWLAYGASPGTPDYATSRSSQFFYYAVKSQNDIDSLPATLTWTISATPGRAAGVVARATGIDLDNIQDSASTTFTGVGNAASINIAGITTNNATTLLVAGVHQQNGANGTSPTATSLLTAFDYYKTSPSGSTLANTGAIMGYQYRTSAGATGTVTASFNSSATVLGGELVAFKAGAWSPPVISRPTIVGVATTYQTAAAVVTFTINKPSGVQDGDLLVMALSGQSPTATGDFASSGWSRVSAPFVGGTSNRITGFYTLAVPTASALTQSTFTFTATDSASGGRVVAEMFVVRGADLAHTIVSISPFGTTSSQTITVQPPTPATTRNLLLTTYNAQFTSAIDYSIGSGPSGMTQHIYLPSSTAAQSKTILAVYQQDIEATAPGAKALTWAGVQSQTSGVAIIIRALGEPDPNPGVALKYTSAPNTLSTAHLYYTSATDTISTPTEVRPFPNGYATVSAMLATSPFYVAHRGGSANWPEMSLHAYTQSGFWGAGALEVSLARTSDGVWFGLHDDTLDRTSGTTGFTASAHTWAEVQAYQITASGTTNPAQSARPYMRWEELMDAYYNSHIFFVDPKAATGYASEILDKMDAMPGTPTNKFVAKYYGVSSSWVNAAKARGYKSWGYFYQADAANFATYQGRWDILGMDYTADAATWSSILSYGKPVIGHIVPSASAATTALGYGAVGLMVSGVQEVVPRSPNPTG